MVEKVPRTEAQLYEHILSTRHGIAFGENHGVGNDTVSITKHMDLFKRKSVDTIYMEGPRDQTNAIGNLSLSEVRERRQTYIDARRHPTDPKNGETMESMQAEAATYHGSVSVNALLDRKIEKFDMVVAAKERGIRIRGMDGTTAEFEKQKATMASDSVTPATLKERVNYGNRTFPDQIERDRKAVDPEEKGKFVVLGGMLHFTNSEFGNGTVAKQLDLAVVGHTKSSPLQALDLSPVERGKNPNGPDYWLESGPRHIDFKKNLGLEKLPADAVKTAENIRHSLSNKKVQQVGGELPDHADPNKPHAGVHANGHNKHAQLDVGAGK